MSIDPEHEKTPPPEPARADRAVDAADAQPTRTPEVAPAEKIKAGDVFRKFRSLKAVEPAPSWSTPVQLPPAPAAGEVDEPGVESGATAAVPTPAPIPKPSGLTFGTLFKSSRPPRPGDSVAELPAVPKPVVEAVSENSPPVAALAELPPVKMPAVSESVPAPPPFPRAMVRVEPEPLIAPVEVEPAPVVPEPDAPVADVSPPPVEAPMPAERSAPTVGPVPAQPPPGQPPTEPPTEPPPMAPATAGEPGTPLESSFMAAHRILVAARHGASAADALVATRVVPGKDPSADESSNAASGAALEHSGLPGVLRAIAIFVRKTAIWAVLLGAAYYGLRTWLIPLVEELRHPGQTDALHDKSASAAVRAIQQTRQVVAKNDARVAVVNAIVDSIDSTKPDPVPPTAAPKEASAPIASANPPGAISVRPAVDPGVFQTAVDRLKIAGVFSGAEPRINIDGQMFKYGDIVDRSVGLRLIGIDPVGHVILFSNMDNVTFKKNY